MSKRKPSHAPFPVVPCKTSRGTNPRELARRFWCAKALTFAVSLAAGLLIGEGLVRLSGAAPDIIPIGVTSEDNVYQRSTNPILGFEFKPGYRSDDKKIPAYYRRINSHGFRDMERSYEKVPGIKRIILLGDSVVLGYGLEDMNQLMSRQLEAIYGDESVEVLNLSVTGYCTRAEIELLKTKGLLYDPDLVVLLFVENDFRNFNPEAFGADGIANRPEIVNSLFRTSHVFRLACNAFNWFNFGFEADPAEWNQRAIGDNNVVEGLRLYRALAEQHAFTPLVAIWPGFTNGAIEYAEKMFLPSSQGLIVESIAKSFGLPVVGLREPFLEHWQAQSPRPNPRLYYTIGDEMHASAAGHRVTAEILNAIIDEQKLLDPAQPQLKPVTANTPKYAVEAAEALGKHKAGYGLVHINKAIELQRDGRLDDAIAEIEPIADADSIHARGACCLLAEFLWQQGKYEQAQNRVQQVLSKDPNNSQAHFILAGIHNSQKNFEEAIHHLKKTISLRPEHFHAHFNWGMIMVVKENWREAETHLRRAVQLAPGNVRASNLLARVQVSQANYREAIKQFRHTLKIDPANQEAHRQIRRLQTHVDGR